LLLPERKVFSFLQRSLLDGVLPNPDTVLNHFFHTSSPLLNEPGFTLARFQRANSFYQRLNYKPMIFHMCNDATALRRLLTWRQPDNALLGLNTLADIRCPDTLEELEALVAHYGIAAEVNVLLLCPLDPSKPSFVLGLFPQQHLQCADIHLQRWATAEEHLERFGMYVVTHGVDGAAPHLLAEKVRQPHCTLPPTTSAFHSKPPAPDLQSHHSSERTKVLSFCVPSLDGHASIIIEAPARIIATSFGPIMLPDLHYQDFCHEGSKLRVRVCGRKAHGVTLGNGRADITSLMRDYESHLWCQMMVGVRKNDVDPSRDPMNLPAFFRLTSNDVLAFLQVRATDSLRTEPALTKNAAHLSLEQLQYVFEICV
jgi:hypothetical protein